MPVNHYTTLTHPVAYFQKIDQLTLRNLGFGMLGSLPFSLYGSRYAFFRERSSRFVVLVLLNPDWPSP